MVIGESYASCKTGDHFVLGGSLWQCTDVGARTLTAIRKINCGPCWYSGPPYAVTEVSFDKCDMKAARLVIGAEKVALFNRQPTTIELREIDDAGWILVTVDVNASAEDVCLALKNARGEGEIVERAMKEADKARLALLETRISDGLMRLCEMGVNHPEVETIELRYGWRNKTEQLRIRYICYACAVTNVLLACCEFEEIGGVPFYDAEELASDHADFLLNPDRPLNGGSGFAAFLRGLIGKPDTEARDK